MRWHYRDGGLLWLFVPAYAIHTAEEWFAGFPDWMAIVIGRLLPLPAFVSINAVAMVLVVFGIRAAVREERFGWIGVAIATVFVINTLAHAAGSLVTRTLSPGLVSAVLLYVPLGMLSLIRAFDQAPRAAVVRGMATGAAIHGIVFAAAYASAV